MSQREIEIRCACFIAQLEGRKQLTTTGFNDPLFLEDLDRRLRFLELRQEAATAIAPPSHATTWESLAWRICRLDNSVKTFTPKVLTKSHFGSLLPECTDVDFDTLVRVVGDLMAKVAVPNGLFSGPLMPKLVNDEEKLDILRQRLFFVAGKRQYRVGEVPMTKREVYILAADLSLDIEPYGSPAMGPFHPGMPGRGRPPIAVAKKMCCGCCNCTCHSSSRPLGVRVLKKRSKFNRFFKFEWLKSLACWRKKKTYSSSDSSSSDSLLDA